MSSELQANFKKFRTRWKRGVRGAERARPPSPEVAKQRRAIHVREDERKALDGAANA